MSRQGLLNSSRRLLVIGVHLILWMVALVGAYQLRFEFDVSAESWQQLLVVLPFLLLARTGTFFYFGLFHGLWRYTGSRDLVSLFKATSISSVALVLFVLFGGIRWFPRSIFILEWLITIMLVGGLRFSVRKLRELASSVVSEEARRNLLILGAGDLGEMLLRELQKNHASRYRPVGFLDDNPMKVGSHIHSVRVLGNTLDLPKVARRYGVEEVIVAMASISGRQMRSILDICKDAEVSVRTVPSMHSLIDGRVTVSQLRKVAIEDLLGREPVVLDSVAVSDFIRNKVALVTGAGGSIGSELCRQICRFGPRGLLLVERAENSLFHIHRELAVSFPELKIIPCIGDITDQARMDEIFRRYAPEVVFHAAAHKHVPMMEWNPAEAMKNNVQGTRRLADLAHAHQVQRFVMVSTDKAVNPTSVMGCTKRIAELYCQALAQHSSTRFVTVRFGNVLGSAGSVLPIFREQIDKGGPVTVTHPDMKRFFMTIPEACQLVLQAGTMGEGGEIFVLDMGEPVRIVDLARDLITLSGLKPGEDVEIRFTGMRPGEKLIEELHIDEEGSDTTKHPRIQVGRSQPRSHELMQKRLDELARLDEASEAAQVRDALRAIVPEFRPFTDGPPPPALEPKDEDAPPDNVIALHR